MSLRTGLKTVLVPITRSAAAMATHASSQVRALRTHIPALPFFQPVQSKFFERVDQPQPILSDKVFTTRNVCIMGGALAFTALSAKVGTLAASQLITHGTIAFLKPGIAVVGFTAKTAISMSVNLAMAGALPIILPIVSTAVVTTLVAAVAFFAIREMLTQPSIQEGVSHLKKFVLNTSNTLIEKVQNFFSFSSFFGRNKVKKRPLTAEEQAARFKTEIQQANADAIEIFKKQELDPKHRAAAQKTLAALSAHDITAQDMVPERKKRFRPMFGAPAQNASFNRTMYAGVYTRAKFESAEAFKKQAGNVAV